MPDPTQTPNKTTCKCPNCGADIDLSLAKAAPAMPSKPNATPSTENLMSGIGDATDTAGMIDAATR